MDDEILQDFLVEAQEILDNLDSQLIELEGRPDDHNLLNAVFRSFHTIKGGAGFLALDALVEVAHKCEDVFDQLRHGRFVLDASIMDVFLRVLDSLKAMFDEIRGGQAPSPAAPELLDELRRIASGQPAIQATPAPPVEAASGTGMPCNESLQSADVGEFDDVVAGMLGSAPADSPTQGAAGAADIISDEAFEALLDSLHGCVDQPAATPVHESPDLITGADFASLLDDLQGARHLATSPPRLVHAAPAGDPNLIGDDEFESLLDKLQASKQVVAPETLAAASTAGDPNLISDEEFEALLDQRQAVAKVSVAAASPAKPRAPAGRYGGDKHVEAANPDANTIRVSTDVLDRIMNMVGELVLIRNRLVNLQAKLADSEVTQAVSSLDVVTSDLQMAAIKTRMQPIKKVFGRFPRVVRDLARNLGKDVELQMSGEETDLDKNLVEALSDPLVHLVRNAVDHGIELPADRLAAGKPHTGVLKLSAEQDGDQILLTIKDDGKGMDAEVLRAKSVEKGLLAQDAALRLTDRECFELIFLPGFSTKDEISDVSGRGVGMDVVKTRITQLNGNIEIDSRVGVGSTIRIRVPLTLAIMPTLMVHLGHQIFALPLVNVREIIDFRRDQARDVNGKKSLVVRGRALPLFYLSRWLIDGVHDMAVDEGHVVIVSVGSQSIGLIVDELLGQEEVVIKPLGAMLHGTRGLSGATITGDGRIALILDLPGLLEAYGRG